jgi:hypothetical protein
MCGSCPCLFKHYLFKHYLFKHYLFKLYSLRLYSLEPYREMLTAMPTSGYLRL